jgi:uncharacterized protein (TIGR02284 family)
VLRSPAAARHVSITSKEHPMLNDKDLGVETGARAEWSTVEAVGVEPPLGRDALIDLLNGLIETCRDGEYGFNACAQHTKTQSLKTVFEQRSQDCTDAALQLYEHILRLGGTPEQGGTTSGAVLRGWAAVRGMLTGYSDYSILDECERGEDMALTRYRKALNEGLPKDSRALVMRQMLGTQKNHDQIRALRDVYKGRN